MLTWRVPPRKMVTALANSSMSCCLVAGFLLANLPSFAHPGPPQSALKSSGSTESSGEENAFHQIEAFVRAKQYQQADSLLQALTPNSPSPAQDYFRMGKLYFDQEEWVRASHYFESSVQARDDNDQAHLLLGIAYRELKQPERAEEEFATAVRMNPRSDVNSYFAGQQFLLDTKFEAALPYLYEAVKLNPRNASAYRALGMTQVHLGNYGLAEEYYRKGIAAAGDARPVEPGPYLDLAFILLLGHEPAKVEEALKLAQRAAAIQPDSADAHYLIGKALMKMGRIKESVPELEWAARHNPQDSKAHFQLALAYDALGEKEKARVERQALAQTKQHANQQGMASGSVMPQSVP